MSFEDFLTKNILTDKSNANNNSFPHLPLEVHLMIKHENMGKIDGHRWFFKGIWDMISPKFVQLIDWGSIPLQNSISHIIEYMNKHKNWGGAWGEIEWITSDQYGDYMGGWSKPKYWIERQTDNIVILTQYIWILNFIPLNLVYPQNLGQVMNIEINDIIVICINPLWIISRILLFIFLMHSRTLWMYSLLSSINISQILLPTVLFI